MAPAYRGDTFRAMAVRRILTLITCGSIAVSTSAFASPRSDPTTGRSVFTGATVPSPTSITLSPAAIGLDTLGTKLYFALTSTLSQIAIDRRTIDLDSGALGQGPRIRDVRLAPGGDLGVLWHPNESLTLGFGGRIPPPELQIEDRASLGYSTLGGGQRTYDATFAVSLRVTGAFYFGASVTHENTFLHLRYLRDSALEAGERSAEDFNAAEQYDVTARTPILATSNLKVNIGTVFRVAPDVWIGLAYHTPPGLDVQTTLNGDMDVTRSPRDGGTLVRGGSTVYVSYPASVDAEVRARLPEELDLHVGGRWEDLSRMQAYDVRGYGSVFTFNGIPEQMLRARGLHDAFAVWAGVEQVDIDERKPLRLGARIGFETSSVDDDHLSPLTVAPAMLTLDLGAQVRLGAWVVQLGYGIGYAPTTSVTDSAFDPRDRLACIDSGYDYTTDACRATRNGYALPTAAGDYARLRHIVVLGLRWDSL
jgi:long-subunit fatty acid transport protein